MNNLYKYSQDILKNSFIKAGLEPFQNKNEKEVKFIVKSQAGKYHEVFLQFIDLERERSIKISKSQLGPLKDNVWIALVLFMKGIEPIVYLIPSTVFEKPDNYIFLENDQGEKFSHLSNWEIKIFTKAIPELSKYTFSEMVKQF